MRRIFLARPGGILALFAVLSVAAVTGCNQKFEHPAEASPVVSVDSEKGKQAIAEADALVKLRKAQESKVQARARKRHREFPHDQ